MFDVQIHQIPMQVPVSKIWQVQSWPEVERGQVCVRVSISELVLS